MSKTPQKTSKKSLPTNWIRWFIKGSFLIFFMTCVICLWYAYDLPDIKTLEKSERAPSIEVYTKDGELLTTAGDLYGNTILLKNVPKHVKDAVLSIEDHRFYEHSGIDFFSLLRAFVKNVLKGRAAQGGSSITQQLAKNFLVSKGVFSYSDKSLRRKVQELFISIWLEHHFSKDQILSIYLNRIDFGAGVYGFDAAAQRFFGKTLEDISILEAAVLAGMLKAPTRYNPIRHLDAAKDRAKIVISKMVEYKTITKDQGDKAIAQGVSSVRKMNIKAENHRYFTDWVLDAASEYLGTIDRDLIIISTLDLKKQVAAEQALKEIQKEYGVKFNVKESALVSMTRHGEIVAMLGGVDYMKSQFNRATQALRQPGSAFKVFVFLAALENDWTMDKTMEDEPIKFGDWKPQNIDKKYMGTLTLEQALSYSRNTIAVKLLKEVGVKKVLDLVQRLGIQTKLANNLTLALGSGEVTLLDMTGAFAVIANEGIEVIPHGIVEIRDKLTNEILYASSISDKQVVDEHVIVEMEKGLASVVGHGTGRRAKLENEIVLGKSGTSQDCRDAWFIGYSKSDKFPITGIWMGNDDYSPTKDLTGGLIPTLFWKRYNQIWK